MADSAKIKSKRWKKNYIIKTEHLHSLIKLANLIHNEQKKMKIFTLFEYSSSAKSGVNIVFLGLLNHYTEKKKRENKCIIWVLEEPYV